MKISILIPAHNEEKSIAACVESCLAQTRTPDEIIVVNDSSTDQTAQILKKFGSKIKVINNVSRHNKSYAQEKGLEYVTGDIFVSTDADTILDSRFVELIENDFQDNRVAAVAGYVRSRRYNWLTNIRAYDYSIGQHIHKRAQTIMGFMLVIPGAAGAFRTQIFKDYIGFDHDTLTEDLDFTYKLHHHNLIIKYNREAIVYTQDPSTLSSYINQMRRWYGGGWQNLKKHLTLDLISEPGRALELTLIYVEGLTFSLILLLLPIINISLALKVFAFFELTIFIQSIYAAYKEKRPEILTTALYYWFIMLINASIFLEQFIKEIILKRRNLIWFQPERVKL
jgi:cellulose synthase/poly-beta-1,6-N-acetylglucosamine synthase-like glycosyltransferase